MKRSSLFGHVVELYDAVSPGLRPADAIVKEFFRARHYLGSKDRRYISELLFDLFRHYRLIQVYVDECLRSISSEQYIGRAPAVVLVAMYCAKMQNDDINNLLPDIAGLWNTIIPDISCEKFLRIASSVTLPASIMNDAVLNVCYRYSFPEDIVREWVKRLGEDETKLLCDALNSQAPISIRVNTLAATVEECQASLKLEGVEARLTTLSPVGLILPKRLNIPALQAFRRGYFEMQDEGSQLISILVQPVPGSTLVDACAGGGGKTLHLAALMKNSGKILAIEVEEYRLKNIHERLRRAGVSIVQTCLARDSRSVISIGEADAVLIDAPCSGVGTFRRNPASKSTFSVTAVEAPAKKQAELLEQYSVLVKSGGRLVYSTCTLIGKENEEQVEAFLERHPEFELLPAAEILSHQGVKMETDSPYLTLLPHKTTTDGFFAAAMQRR